ncbi:MAG: hypothetical protein R3E98_04000 [Gemmatimonadota bacterium]
MSGSEPSAAPLEVLRTARVWTWGPAEARDAWIVLHGYRQLAGRFLRRFAPLVDQGVRVVAPEGLSRFYLDDDGGPHGPEARIGATWMTREDRDAEIRDYVRYLDRVWQERLPAAVERVTVLGFSQGVHTAARWLSFGRGAPARLVLWGAGLPGDLDLDAVQPRWREVDVVLVHGASDPAHPQAGRARDDARLRGAGIAFRRLEHPGGHRIDADLLRTLR